MSLSDLFNGRTRRHPLALVSHGTAQPVSLQCSGLNKHRLFLTRRAAECTRDQGLDLREEYPEMPKEKQVGNITRGIKDAFVLRIAELRCNKAALLTDQRRSILCPFSSRKSCRPAQEKQKACNLYPDRPLHC